MLFGGVPRIVSYFTLQPVQHKALHRIHPAILRVGPDDVLCLLLDACGSKPLENVRLAQRTGVWRRTVRGALGLP